MNRDLIIEEVLSLMQSIERRELRISDVFEWRPSPDP
jgi:hypothetical protein